MLIGGAPAFWSAKLGNLQLLKGRTWLVVAVGGAKPVERDAEAVEKGRRGAREEALRGGPRGRAPPPLD